MKRIARYNALLALFSNCARAARADCDCIDREISVRALGAISAAAKDSMDCRFLFVRCTSMLLATADEFGILPDGPIAMARAHDGHGDWIGADGSRRSTPTMA